MRIAHLYKDYHPPVRGGIEQTVERMAREQVRTGAEVTVLTSANGKRRTRIEQIEGVRLVRCAEWGRVASAPLCPSMPFHLARLEADLYHLHFPNPTGELSWLVVRPRAPMVVTYHSDIIRQAAVLPIYSHVIRALLGRAAVIMPTSEAYIERSPFLRSHRDKCMTVPLGVDIEPFRDLSRHADAAAALRARYGTPLIVFVGRLRYYKGVDVLLEAMRRTEGSLIIVGDGPEAPGLRKQCASLELGGRVTFCGTLDDEALAIHLAAADVGVLPSTHPSEALGMAMIEMLACGIPVVCTELGTGTSFVNRHEETGLVVPPRDPRALADALNRMLADPGLRRRYGEAGRRRAHELFSRQSMMRGVDQAYQRALSGS